MMTNGGMRTVLPIVMYEGVRPRDVVLLADNATSAEGGWRAAHSEVGLANARVGNAVALGGKMAGNHGTTEVGKYGEDVGEGAVELGVGEGGDWGGDGCVLLVHSAIGTSLTSEDWRAWLDEAKAESFATHGAGGTLEDAGDFRRAAHLEGVLKEGGIDEL